MKLAIGRAREFACAAKVFAPLAPTLASLKRINMLLVLHLPNTDSPCSKSLLNVQLDSNLELSMDFFRLAFLCTFHLLAKGSFGIVFEHLQKNFNLEDLVNALI
jgi:hypothetical protein